MSKLGWRKIIVEGVEYKWRYGRGNAVVRGPNVKWIFPDKYFMPDTDPQVIEKMKYNGSWSITPADIEHQIKIELSDKEN